MMNHRALLALLKLVKIACAFMCVACLQVLINIIYIKMCTPVPRDECTVPNSPACIMNWIESVTFTAIYSNGPVCKGTKLIMDTTSSTMGVSMSNLFNFFRAILTFKAFFALFGQ